MRFVMTPVGSSGDVHPFIGVGRALAARGHDVVIATSATFEHLIRRAGLGFYPTASAEEFDAVSRHPDIWHPVRGLRIVLGEVTSRLRQGTDCLQALYEPGRTVLVGHTLSLSTRIFEELHGAPAATLHLAPSVFRSDHRQPAVSPGHTLSRWPIWVKRGVWLAVDRLLIDPMVAPALNRFRQEVGLPPVTRVFADYLHSPQRVIGLFPDWFGPPQPDWPSALRLTGFPLYDESDQSETPPALAAFLDGGSPPLLFTPGSANQSALPFFEAALDASARLGRRALLLTRYSDQLPAVLPPTAHHEPFAPLSRVLPRCAAIVHHGGIGTLAQGLAAGVPQLVMPMGFDQPDNATRLQDLGVGRWIVPRRFRGDTVAETLGALLRDPGTQTACRRWARALERSDGASRTGDLLEELGVGARRGPASVRPNTLRPSLPA